LRKYTPRPTPLFLATRSWFLLLSRSAIGNGADISLDLVSRPVLVVGASPIFSADVFHAIVPVEFVGIDGAFRKHMNADQSKQG